MDLPQSGKWTRIMREPVDKPLAFAPEDEGAWQRLARGYRLAGLLLSSHRLGLLERLRRGDAATEELAAELAADADVVHQLCRGLAAAGVLAWDDRWALSDDGRRLLDDPAATAELDSLVLDYRRWGMLDERARRPPDPVEGAAAREPADPDTARRYALRLAARHRGQAVALIEQLTPTRAVRVMDVGGADGFLAREICERWPDAECVVLEQPAMAAVAHSTCADIDRITVVEGEFLGDSDGPPSDELPGDADVVVLSHVLQGRPDAHQRTLVARAAAALTPGGCLLSCESVLRSDARGPLDTILWAVGQAALRRPGHMLTTLDQDVLIRASGLAATGSWWVSDSTRAVMGVNTAVGAQPALQPSSHATAV